MLLSELVRVSTDVAATRSRLEKRALLAELISRATRDDIRLLVSYLSGELPQGRIGIGPATLHKVLGGLTSDGTGQSRLSLAEVDQTFDDIAAIGGRGASAAKHDALSRLLDRAGDAGAEFLTKLISGELRQGALEAILLESLADATGIDLDKLRRAAMLTADVTDVATVAVRDGADGLDTFRLTPLSPVRPMLAQPAATLDAALEAIANPIVDLKLDGARVQIHKAGSEVRIFSRQLNDVTSALPDIVASVRTLPAESAILDGEAMALRPDGRPQPFQVTMRRFGRKSIDIDAALKTPLALFLFDCLFLDGEALIDRPLHERKARLAGIAPDLLVPQTDAVDVPQLSRFFRQALDDGHEGVMVKQRDSVYAAGNRGADWLKVKHAHTLDLVVLAAEWGSGRRKGWLSNLHLGARDGDAFVMLGKTFKGLTDKLLRWQTRELLARETHRDRHAVYVRPELVVEIAVNEIQASPQYPAGLALRFARVKAYRNDKPAAEADTIDTVREIHRQFAE